MPIQEEREETRKCLKYDKKGHIVKNCKKKQSIKEHKVQEESDDEDDNGKNNDKKQSFGNDLE